MPISSRACPWVAPEVTSLRPSRLATRTAGAPVESPGTVIPAGGGTRLGAGAALVASIVDAAAAAGSPLATSSTTTGGGPATAAVAVAVAHVTSVRATVAA